MAEVTGMTPDRISQEITKEITNLKTHVDSGLSTKADTTYVNSGLSKKADVTYVDTSLSKKADTTQVNSDLSKKADTTYVDTGLSEKASITYVDSLSPLKSFVGSGFPEGKVSAPVGSIYTDTEVTNGAIRWIKTSGTGSDGWVVEYGDTGVRDISDFLKDSTGSVTISRIGQVVYLEARDIKPEETLRSGSSFLATLPVGFRPATRRDFPINATLSSSTTRSGFQFISGSIGVWNPSTSDIYYFQHHWITTNTWPTSLPGTPA